MRITYAFLDLGWGFDGTLGFELRLGLTNTTNKARLDLPYVDIQTCLQFGKDCYCIIHIVMEVLK